MPLLKLASDPKLKSIFRKPQLAARLVQYTMGYSPEEILWDSVCGLPTEMGEVNPESKSRQTDVGVGMNFVGNPIQRHYHVEFQSRRHQNTGNMGSLNRFVSLADNIHKQNRALYAVDPSFKVRPFLIIYAGFRFLHTPGIVHLGDLFHGVDVTVHQLHTRLEDVTKLSLEDIFWHCILTDRANELKNYKLNEWQTKVKDLSLKTEDNYTCENFDNIRRDLLAADLNQSHCEELIRIAAVKMRELEQQKAKKGKKSGKQFLNTFMRTVSTQPHIFPRRRQFLLDT